jgi:hypothetical protein
MDCLEDRAGRGQTQNLVGHVSIPDRFYYSLFWSEPRLILFPLRL